MFTDYSAFSFSRPGSSSEAASFACYVRLSNLIVPASGVFKPRYAVAFGSFP